MLVQDGVAAIPDVAQEMAGFLIADSPYTSVGSKKVTALVGVLKTSQRIVKPQAAMGTKVFARFINISPTAVRKSVPTRQSSLYVARRAAHQDRPNTFH